MAQENKRLRQQVADLRRANEILKVASAYFAAERPGFAAGRHEPPY